MTEHSLTSLHARLSRETAPADAGLAARMVALARGELSGAERELAVAEVARSATAATAYRLARASLDDASQLAEEISALPGRGAAGRRRRVPVPLRWALAAGLGAIALLAVRESGTPDPGSQDAPAVAEAATAPLNEPQERDTLFVASFEEGAAPDHESRQRNNGSSIFSGGFDAGS